MSPEEVDLGIRPATPADRWLLWVWANDPVVRASSFVTDPIPWSDHVVWFNARLDDTECHIYVINQRDGTPVGQVRFEPSADRPHLEIDVAIALACDARGHGLGAHVLRLACEEFRRERASPATLVAHVRVQNTASVRTFERAGFRLGGRVQVSGVDTFRFESPCSFEMS